MVGGDLNQSSNASDLHQWYILFTISMNGGRTMKENGARHVAANLFYKGAAAALSRLHQTRQLRCCVRGVRLLRAAHF